MSKVLAVVSDAIYPFHMGGKEVRYHHLIEGLAAGGLEVHVFTMKWWEGDKHQVRDGVHYHALCRRYPLYRKRRRSVLEAAMFSLACLRLVTYRFDVIEADHMPHLQLFAIRLVSWIRRVPLVVTWHEFWGREYWREYLGRLGPLAAAIEATTMGFGDRIVTPSAGTRNRLIEHGRRPEQVTVIPNGLDYELLSSVEPAKQRFDLLFVGRLVAHKHVDMLLEALVDLPEHLAEVTCAIVGQGPELPAIEATIGRLGLASRVHLLGNLDRQEDVFALMRSARVFVLPSTREGFGIVVAEAIACGLLVVTIDHEDNHARSLLRPGVSGWLCQLSVESLASCLERALLSDEDHEADAARAAERADLVDKLSWDASVNAMAALLSEVSVKSRFVVS